MLQHYLYFDTEQAASDASGELRTHGYSMQCRLAADRASWLVLAKNAP
jgi:hypothetical protein